MGTTSTAPRARLTRGPNVSEVIEEELLPEIDREFLEQKGFDYEAAKAGNDTHVFLKNWQFPAAYSPRVAEVKVILPAGYPNANLDMWWTNPTVRLASGASPKNCDHHETINGVTWQRWSRHFPPDRPWRVGTDNLRTFITVMMREIAKGI